MSSASIPRGAVVVVGSNDAASVGTETTRARHFLNALFLAAVVAINFTLLRPSPVDILFTAVLVLSVLTGQIVNRNILILAGLVLAWTMSLYVSTIPEMSEPEAGMKLLKITYAISIAIASCLVASLWHRLEYERFLTVYTIAAALAATLGTVGYLLDIDDLLWDDRAKALLDDPNMYGAFLIPGVLICMFKLRNGRQSGYVAALAVIAFGLLLSFSRAAIVSCTVWSAVFYVVLNRHRLVRAGALAVGGAMLIALLIGGSALVTDSVVERLSERSTVAKEYDLGHEGRYGRYSLSVPYILDNPLGLGPLAWDRQYDEPIHNLWISSFMNYGWVAGVSFTLLLLFTISIAAQNYRRTRNEIVLVIALSWAGILSCTFLHQAERWRHLWLFTGLVWSISARNASTLSDVAAGGRRTPAKGPPAGNDGRDRGGRTRPDR